MVIVHIIWHTKIVATGLQKDKFNVGSPVEHPEKDEMTKPILNTQQPSPMATQPALTSSDNTQVSSEGDYEPSMVTAASKKKVQAAGKVVQASANWPNHPSSRACAIV